MGGGPERALDGGERFAFAWLVDDLEAQAEVAVESGVTEAGEKGLALFGRQLI